MDNKPARETPVPKFTSFRPKLPPTVIGKPEVSIEEGTSTYRKRGRRHDRGRYDGNEQRYKDTAPCDHRRHVSERRGGLHGNERSPERSIVDWDGKTTPFLVDKQGDEENIKYGSVHRYSVPAYHRSGYGNVLGLSRYEKIDRAASTDTLLVIGDIHRDSSSVRGGDPFRHLEKQSVKRLRLQPNLTKPSPLDTSQDFISLRTDGFIKSIRDHRSTSFSGSSEAGDWHYRSINGKSKGNEHPEELGFAYASSPSSSDNEISETADEPSALRRRNTELSRAVEEDPTDTEAWLALIEHQDLLLGVGDQSERRKVSNAERLSIADIKLSMYEKSLELAGQTALNRVKLIAGMMDEGNKVWGSKKLQDKWRAVLRDHPSSILLWTKYLDYEQTNFTDFKYENMKRVYLECLKVIHTILESSSSAIDSKEEIEYFLVYILVRATLYMQESGFYEHALAIWQALLEIHFFMHPQHRMFGHRNDDGLSWLASFEEFWESEVSRIGEPEATGWASHVARGVFSPVPDPITDEALDSPDTKNLMKSWENTERKRAIKSGFPARTGDDVAEDDPFRVVLFSDIREWLFVLSEDNSHSILLNGLLCFCHLPPLRSAAHTNSEIGWWTDSFMRNDLLQKAEARILDLLGAQSPSTNPILESEGTSNTKDPFRYKFQNFLSSLDIVHSSKKTWFSAFEARKCSLSGLDYIWIHRAFKSLVDAKVGGIEFAEYFIAFELELASQSDIDNIIPRTVHRTSKALLKNDTSSLRLWNAHAIVEYEFRGPEFAEKIFKGALGMSSSFTSAERLNTILLWKTWIWSYFDRREVEEAFLRLLCVQGGLNQLQTLKNEQAQALEPWRSGVRGQLTMKAREHLQSGFEAMISFGYTLQALAYADLLSMLEYIQSNLDISPALSAYQTCLDTLSSRGLTNSSTLEFLHQSRARLLYHHFTTSHSYRPAQFRNALTDSLQLFPNNTIFMTLYAWNESRFRVDDRVRSIVRDVVLHRKAESIIGWVFSIYNELTRAPGMGGNIHSMKGVFERAVESDVGRKSAALWKMYLLFAVERLDGKSAKAVFYRGMRNCPWAKEYMMLAFTHLRGVMDDGELKSVYGVMVDKELRIHVDMEAWFEDPAL